MKKIISMGIASAVLSLTAVAAFAEANTAEAPIVDILPAEGSENAVSGEQYVVDIFTTAETQAIEFYVEWEGLEFVSAETPVGTFKANNSLGKNKYNAFKGISEGQTLVTLTFTVTADVGEPISVSLVASDDAYASAVEGIELNAVAVDDDNSDISGDSGDSGESGESGDSGDASGAKPGDKDNPGTGIALAIVPAVLAGAGVVVAKKRK